MFLTPYIPDAPAAREIAAALGAILVDIRPVGSRVTCDPPPADTDEDWLVLIRRDPTEALKAAGFRMDGRTKFYTGKDAGSFRSWRKPGSDINIITTPYSAFYELFETATLLAKRFNLLDKGDRIALFQAVLYDVRWDNLEPRYGRVDADLKTPENTEAWHSLWEAEQHGGITAEDEAAAAEARTSAEGDGAFI